jgi:hypothetical protein
VVRHAARALPWPLLAATAALLYALLSAVERWPYQVWPLQGLAVGLVAGVAAFAYDEPAAAVVDTLPRGLAWRTLARSLGVLLLLGWWLVVVRLTDNAYFGHQADVAWQGVGATLAVVAITTHLRRTGLACPGGALATGVVAAAACLSLVRPLESRVPLFPYLSTGPWAASRTWWSAILLCGAAWLALSLAERGRVTTR